MKGRTSCSTHGRLLVISVFVATAGVLAWAQAITGPSSSASPYMLRVEPGVVTAAILTTGDAVDGYRLAGIPDGLGAFDNVNGTFTLLVNHEIPGSAGDPARARRTGRVRLPMDHSQERSRRGSRERFDPGGGQVECSNGIVGCSRERRGDIAPVFR